LRVAKTGHEKGNVGQIEVLIKSKKDFTINSLAYKMNSLNPKFMDRDMNLLLKISFKRTVMDMHQRYDLI